MSRSENALALIELVSLRLNTAASTVKAILLAATAILMVLFLILKLRNVSQVLLL